MCHLRLIQLLFTLGVIIVFGDSYYVKLSSNGPIVLGATVKFTAEFLLANNEVPTGDFEFKWEDNAMIPHKYKDTSTSHISTWEVSYPADVYVPGPYEVQVAVYKWEILDWWWRASQKIGFNITVMLNGEMHLEQKNKSMSKYISSAEPVHHEIVLSKPDMDYLTHNATSVLTYWFINCVNYGFSSDLKYSMNFTEPEKEYYIEALVVVGYEPITTTTVAPTTTTSTTTTTTTSTTTTTTTLKPTTTTAKTTTSTASTTTSSTSTTIKSNPSSESLKISTNKPLLTTSIDNTTIVNKPLQKRSIQKSGVTSVTTSQINKIEGFPLSNENITMPFICHNKSVIPADPKKTYGHFQRKVIVKAPVNNVTVIGNNWLQHGDLLNLHIVWKGSAPYYISFCHVKGLYNITGNETCPESQYISVPEYNFSRYLSDTSEYTLIIIVTNDVTKNVSSVTVTVYKAIHHPQLSVIVVPVSFSLVAVVLIVFGIAYYIQSRTRYTVEVADFDFGQQYSDLEYKTFRERLRESVINAFRRTPTLTGQESPDWSPTTSGSGFKYGSMT